MVKMVKMVTMQRSVLHISKKKAKLLISSILLSIQDTYNFKQCLRV